MRRDRELLHQLLLKLEELPSQPGDIFYFSGEELELSVAGYSIDQIQYHLSLLKEEGYIDSPGSQPMIGVSFRSLMPAGHDLVDRYRENLQLQAVEMAAEESRKWISAAEAVRLLMPVFKSAYLAQSTICKRAHGGLIHARADSFIVDAKKTHTRFDIPPKFWWAKGEAALHQNWTSGDFDTWIDQTTHLEAFGVSFLRADIEKVIPADQAGPAESVAAPPSLSPTIGGRPPADWWEDLLIEICFRHFRGELQPKTQADVARAMQAWMTEHGYEAADSTVRLRARKVWSAIQKDAEN